MENRADKGKRREGGRRKMRKIKSMRKEGRGLHIEV